MASRRRTTRLNSPNSVSQPGVGDGQDEHADTPNAGCTLGDKAYNMQHENRGVALIFNHENFNKREVAPKKRVGTQEDCDGLCNVLWELGFDVRVHKDYTHQEITTVLQQVADEDHRNADCLLVAVLTHGDCNRLRAKDEGYNIAEIWKPFLGNSCPSLVGKPKIFIIQACRGQKRDKGVLADPDNESGQPQIKIPTQCDVLIAFASVFGFTSYRSKTGTWFIQSLIAELRENGTEVDLLTLLTYVNRRVAAITPPPRTGKQMPNFNSTLTKILKFTVPKHTVPMSMHQEPGPVMLEDSAAGTVHAPEVNLRTSTARACLHVRNLHVSTTLEQMIRYLHKRGVTDITECRQLRSDGCKKTIKVVIPLADLQKTKAPGFWKRGIKIRNFNSSRNTRE